MNQYVEKLNEELQKNDPDFGNGDCRGLLDMLYRYYQEENSLEDQEIESGFAKLDSVLCKLTLREYDIVWYAVCKLCGDHQHTAFLEGIRVGVHLEREFK